MTPPWIRYEAYDIKVNCGCAAWVATHAVL